MGLDDVGNGGTDKVKEKGGGFGVISGISRVGETVVEMVEWLG